MLCEEVQDGIRACSKWGNNICRSRMQGVSKIGSTFIEGGGIRYGEGRVYV